MNAILTLAHGCAGVKPVMSARAAHSMRMTVNYLMTNLHDFSRQHGRDSEHGKSCDTV